MISLKEQILLKRAQRLNVTWEKKRHYVSATFCDWKIPLLSLLFIWSSNLGHCPPPIPQLMRTPARCISIQDWVAEKTNSPWYREWFGRSQILFPDLAFGKFWAQTPKQSQGNWSPGIFIKEWRKKNNPRELEEENTLISAEYAC